MKLNDTTFARRVLEAIDRNDRVVFVIVPDRKTADHFFAVIAIESTSLNKVVTIKSIRQLHLVVDQSTLLFVVGERSPAGYRSIPGPNGVAVIEHDQIRFPRHSVLLSRFA